MIPLHGQDRRLAGPTQAALTPGTAYVCRFGHTSSSRLVDMEAVEQLQGMGYERRLCAEALRQVYSRCLKHPNSWRLRPMKSC